MKGLAQGPSAGRRRGSPRSATCPQVQRSGRDAPPPPQIFVLVTALHFSLPQGAFGPPASMLGLWVQGAPCLCEGRPEMMTVSPAWSPGGLVPVHSSGFGNRGRGPPTAAV